MERDFMGLAVKQEMLDEPIDAAPIRSSPMNWSFSNKASAPQFLPFHVAQEERVRTGFDSLASAGLVTITTTEAFNSDKKSYPDLLQNNVVTEAQCEVGYTVTNYPTQPVHGHAIHHQFSNQTNLTVSPTAGSAVHRSFVAAAGPSIIGSIGSQPLAGVPTANPVATMPSNSAVVGTTDLRNPSRISGAPAQLTIFYNGSVSVFDSISPEKAQAIMLLAGNGPPVNSSPTGPAAPVQASMPRSSFLEGLLVQPYITTPRRSSPTSITSISVPRSGGWPRTISDSNASKQRGILVSPNKVEHMKVVDLSGSVSATNPPSGTVPQFRRKSLARFLEKRKERVINTSSYANTIPEASSTSLSMNSSGSCPVPPIN